MTVKIAAFVLCASLVIDKASGIGVTELGLGGIGSRSKDADVENYKYKFSSGFRGQLCDSCTWGRTGKWYEDITPDACWMPQGISYADGYIVRAFYQKAPGACATYDDAEYIALSVIDAEQAKYSNILVKLGIPCHAGDVVLTQIDGEYFFMVACTSKVAIFSEQAIVSKTVTVFTKKFYYYVDEPAVIIKDEEDVSFSYLSKNHGHANQYWAGAFSEDSSTDKLNLKLINIDPDNDWEITELTQLEVSSSAADAKRIQGATRIGDAMVLTGGTASTGIFIIKCSMENNVLADCEQQCSISAGCSDSFETNMVLQGAETDDDGNLYVGSEAGTCFGMPFFQLGDLSPGDSCVASSIAPLGDVNVEYRVSNHAALIGLFALFLITMFTCCVNCVFYATKKKDSIPYQSVKVISSSADEEN